MLQFTTFSAVIHLIRGYYMTTPDNHANLYHILVVDKSFKTLNILKLGKR